MDQVKPVLERLRFYTFLTDDAKNCFQYLFDTKPGFKWNLFMTYLQYEYGKHALLPAYRNRIYATGLTPAVFYDTCRGPLNMSRYGNPTLITYDHIILTDVSITRMWTLKFRDEFD